MHHVLMTLKERAPDGTSFTPYSITNSRDSINKPHGNKRPLRRFFSMYNLPTHTLNYM